MDDLTERRMNFIVEQSAKHAVSIQQLDERMDRVEKQQEVNVGMIRQLVEVAMSLTNHIQETDERLGKRIDELGERMAELAESQAHSDRRLDSLIDVVDKLARRNGNGS